MRTRGKIDGNGIFIIPLPIAARQHGSGARGGPAGRIARVGHAQIEAKYTITMAALMVEFDG